MLQKISIVELKNPDKISEYCHAVNEPVFITKDGICDMVIMSLETYANISGIQDIYSKLAVAEEQIRTNHIMSAAESLKLHKTLLSR